MSQTNTGRVPLRWRGRVVQLICPCAGASLSGAALVAALAAGLTMQAPTAARADEGGISFWLPGLFGSLAAAPLQPGLSITSFWYNDNVHAGANVTRAREVTIGGIPLTANASLSGNVKAQAELAIFDPTYTFATPVLGGQLSVALFGSLWPAWHVFEHDARRDPGTPLGTIPFARSDMINELVTGFGDLYPQAFLRWNAGVNNYMVYMTGDIPVGAYDFDQVVQYRHRARAVDGGAGYTYFDPKDGPRILGRSRFHLQRHQPVDPVTRAVSICTWIGAPRSF